MNIIRDITAYKIVLSNNNVANNDAITKFNSALNLIPIIFQNNKEVVEKYKELISKIDNETTDLNTPFYNLVMSLHDDIKIPKTEKDIFFRAAGVGISK